MKALFFTALFFISLHISAQKSYSIYVEEMNKLTKKGVHPAFTVLAMYTPAQKQFGAYVFTQTTFHWSQFLVGATYKPKIKQLDACTFRLGVGIEHDKIPLRMQTALFLAKKNFSMLAVFEYGGSGPFYLFSPTYTVKQWFFGIHAHKFYGVGPKIGFNDKHITIWVAPMYEIEERQYTGTVTLSITF